MKVSLGKSTSRSDAMWFGSFAAFCLSDWLVSLMEAAVQCSNPPGGPSAGPAARAGMASIQARTTNFIFHLMQRTGRARHHPLRRGNYTHFAGPVFSNDWQFK